MFSHVPIIARCGDAQGNGKAADLCAWRYNPDGSLNAGKYRAGLDSIELQPQIGLLLWQHECTSGMVWCLNLIFIGY
jgi:hypothetical protein